MSSSPAVEHSPPPTTPSSPSQRAAAQLDYLQQYTSTPNYLGRKPNPPLNVILPSVGPSTPSIPSCEPTPTPPPRSPGAACAAGDGRTQPPPDGTSSDKSSETAVGGVVRTPSSVLSRKESYKAQRQHYRREKKRAASALLHSIEDPAAVVLADWLKVRGSLKSWTKLWCVLKPGLLLLYKSPKAKSSHWVGTVLLTSCQVIERPSKKDGFCFKLYHPLEQSIWAPRGPHNETIGAVVQPLPTAHLIFRAPSQAAGHCWLDGLELALRCSNAMLRCSRSRGSAGSAGETGAPGEVSGGVQPPAQLSHEELEKHFNEHELAGAASDSDTDSAGGAGVAGSEAPGAPGSTVPAGVVDSHEADRRRRAAIAKLDQLYVDDAIDDIGVSGELVEEVTEENKSLLWFLVKQVRPGMDLSKVVLPTFILEPRSFLDKLSDNYYHADLLASASQCDDPYSRFKGVLRWYLSGMYKKPRGLKKPYNPVLGEIFRCRWRHPNSHTYTYYIAEQVSHHPPVSAFYITNRHEGFVIQGSLLARSKFYGNSTSAILEGCARVYLLRWGETYITTAPYAQCKGIVIGTLSMELGGKVVVLCPDTGYSAEIEFKLKSFLGGSDQTNAVSGKIKKSGVTIATLDGYWDGRIDIREKQTGEEVNLIDVASLKEARLKRSLVRLSRQQENESQRLWARVSEAIVNDDQITATEEKTVVEEAQRERSRKMTGPWIPKYFHRNGAPPPPEGVVDQGWLYNHSNIRVWESDDILEYEDSFVMRTLRASPSPGGTAVDGVPAPGLLPSAGSVAAGQLSPLAGVTGVVASGSRHSQPMSDSDSRDGLARRTKVSTRTLKLMLANIDTTLKEQAVAIDKLTRAVNVVSERQKQTGYGRRAPSPQRHGKWKLIMAGFVMAMFLQAFMNWLFAPKVMYKDLGGAQDFRTPPDKAEL